MSGWTPGPWWYQEVGPEECRTRMIIGPPGSGRWTQAPRVGLVVAEMRSHAGDEGEANWRLMAAAPDLAEACDEVDRCLGPSPAGSCSAGCQTEVQMALHAVRAALAKARGEA